MILMIDSIFPNVENLKQFVSYIIKEHFNNFL